MEDLNIPKAAPEKERKEGSGRMKRGANMVRIINIETTKDANGKVKKNKKGNTGIDFTFATKEKVEHKETFWLGDAQWRMDKMLEAFGFDNKKNGMKAAEVVASKKKAWMVMKEVFQLENGVQKMKEFNGKEYPVSYMNVVEFKKIEGTKSEPVYAEEKLVEYKNTVTDARPANTKKAATTDFTPETEEEENDEPDWVNEGEENEEESKDDWDSL